MKHLIHKENVFTMELEVHTSILVTKLLYFNENFRGTGELLRLSSEKNHKGYFYITFQSNSYSYLYNNPNNINVVINGVLKAKDSLYMTVDINKNIVNIIIDLLKPYLITFNKIKIL